MNASNSIFHCWSNDGDREIKTYHSVLTIFTFKAYICGYIPRKRKNEYQVSFTASWFLREFYTNYWCSINKQKTNQQIPVFKYNKSRNENGVGRKIKLPLNGTQIGQSTNVTQTIAVIHTISTQTHSSMLSFWSFSWQLSSSSAPPRVGDAPPHVGGAPLPDLQVYLQNTNSPVLRVATFFIILFFKWHTDFGTDLFFIHLLGITGLHTFLLVTFNSVSKTKSVPIESMN